MIVVRPEEPADFAAIRAAHEASFPPPAEARLVDALHEAGRLAISLVAEAGGVRGGHAAFQAIEL